jgi:hypothetical protein
LELLFSEVMRAWVPVKVTGGPAGVEDKMKVKSGFIEAEKALIKVEKMEIRGGRKFYAHPRDSHGWVLIGTLTGRAPRYSGEISLVARDLINSPVTLWTGRYEMNEGALTVDQGLTDYVRSFLTSVIAEVTKTK